MLHSQVHRPLAHALPGRPLDPYKHDAGTSSDRSLRAMLAFAVRNRSCPTMCSHLVDYFCTIVGSTSILPNCQLRCVSLDRRQIVHERSRSTRAENARRLRPLYKNNKNNLRTPALQGIGQGGGFMRSPLPQPQLPPEGRGGPSTPKCVNHRSTKYLIVSTRALSRPREIDTTFAEKNWFHETNGKATMLGMLLPPIILYLGAMFVRANECILLICLGTIRDGK